LTLQIIVRQRFKLLPDGQGHSLYCKERLSFAHQDGSTDEQATV